MKNKKTEREPRKVYATFPLADTHTVDPVSKMTMPSADDVKEAKDWVDFNEK